MQTKTSTSWYDITHGDKPKNNYTKRPLNVYFLAFLRCNLSKFITQVYIAVSSWRVLFINFVKNCCISPLRQMHNFVIFVMRDTLQLLLILLLLLLMFVIETCWHAWCGRKMSQFWRWELTKGTYLYTTTDLHGVCGAVVVDVVVIVTVENMFTSLWRSKDSMHVFKERYENDLVRMCLRV